MLTLSGTLPNLHSFEINVLRTTSFGKAEWDKDEKGGWKGGIAEPQMEIPQRPQVIPEDAPEEIRACNEDGAT